MKKQINQHTPISSRSKKTILQKTTKHFSSDNTIKTKNYKKSPTNRPSTTIKTDKNDDSIDHRIIYEIFGPEKLHKSMKNSSFQNNNQLKSKSCNIPNSINKKSLKKLQNSKSTSVSPLLGLDIIKNYIDNYFDDYDTEITLQQLENMLQHFSIIENNVDEDLLISNTLVDQSRVEKSNRSRNLYSILKLKNILFSSLENPTKNQVTQKVSNSIKKSILNKMSTNSNRPSQSDLTKKQQNPPIMT